MGNTIFAAQAADDIQTFGRVMPDPDGKALWFNWTASGFALRFRGSTLRVCLRGMPQEMTAPFLTEHIMVRPVIGVHVDGAFYLSRAVLPAMIRKKSGRIIQISSMWGISGGSCEVAYSAAKAALSSFSPRTRWAV